MSRCNKISEKLQSKPYSIRDLCTAEISIKNYTGSCYFRMCIFSANKESKINQDCFQSDPEKRKHHIYLKLENIAFK